MPLVCVSRYSSSLGYYQPGDTITDVQLAAALLTDSPGSFRYDEVQTVALDEATEHRAVTRRRKP